ncbi:hypothetical protein SH611_20375 [Geminicoccaceae bacterium 1502E]|nr:hypothetical protein [Geminicoccaceae bacterium 1502E]
MRRAATALAAAVLLHGTAVAPAAGSTVTELVFERGLLAGLEAPARLHYRIESRGKDAAEPSADEALMEVRAAAAAGEKEIWFDIPWGDARRELGPVAASSQNPLVLVFLQRDVNEMGRRTGGAPLYFQQQIRMAFNVPAEAEAVTVQLDGHEIAATRVRIRPFRNDPNIARFPGFRDKIYEFVVADGIPGGLYRIAATTPDPVTGELLLEKSMTFEGMER